MATRTRRPPPAAPAGASPSALADAFRTALLAQAPAGELDGLSQTQIDRLVELALQAFTHRPAGAHVVKLGTVEAEAGSRRMTLVLVTDDMPFLVDSATAAITRAGLGIERLLHPVLSVERDAQGHAVGLGGPDGLRESIVVMEVERAPARRRAELLAELDRVYAHVRLAVSDWRAMLDRLHAAARRLNDSPPPVAPFVLAENVAFLEWLAADNFTFLGSLDAQGPKGILKDPERFPPPPEPEGQPEQPVVVGKSTLVATVHRAVPMDLVTVRRYDAQGRIEGSARFLGLFTSAALAESPRRVPLVRRKVAQVTEALGLDPRGHAGRALAHVIETFPREILFQVDAERLRTMAQGLLSLLDRPRPRLFVNRDPATGALSVLVYVPRDVYSAEVRQRLAGMLADATGGEVSRFEVELRSEGLARVNFVVVGARADVDEAALDARLARLLRGWDEALAAALAERAGPLRAARLALTFGRAFPPGYRASFDPATAAEDLLRLADLSTPADRKVALYVRPDDPPTTLRLKIYRLSEIIPLSEAVPMLENFGFRVIAETPHALAHGVGAFIHDFRLEGPPRPADLGVFRARIEPALEAVLQGRQENDPFNALIPSVGLSAEEADWFRAWFRYLRQTGISYSMGHVVDVLRRNAELTRLLIARFRARFGPHPDPGAEAEADRRFAAGLADVPSLDDDNILSLFRTLVGAMRRTNAFVPGRPEALAFKFDSGAIPHLPQPRPWREIWVHSPRVEGVHLRGGRIARGGVRWSDRRDDFRTEILGLLKAQMVKNAVIVPTGAKGGFYPKQLPDPAQRDAWAAEGREAYRIFIRALLSLTDNLDAEGRVVPPEFVVRHDPDDPYLVVAADKGTASFSDDANAIARHLGFWLDDAFASGGSTGYDHKGMGITARGAWVSVVRHFAELGVDVHREPITVVGVGDMSGDVFGNGLLRSKSLRLVAAFDHRHIFLDPDPDPAASYAERRRLFRLERSSWADYDPARLSRGGGVFPRSQKSIPLSPEMRARLGVSAERMTPSELISAILKAPVDLIWFGGIGTFVKAEAESHADVGDRANDAHRVNAEDLRAKVVAEGANLAVTQRGRVAFALAGGRINTDFIDNSAGVDTSDREVNIKIALRPAVAEGRLTPAARHALLAHMTDEVAALVLENNAAQTLALSVEERRAATALADHVRLMQALEERGRLDRRREMLPDDRGLAERRQAGRGLTRPELAVLLAYTKIDLKDALLAGPGLDDPLLEPDLFAAFPERLHEAHGEDLRRHPLRREILATRIANLLVNRCGMALAHALAAELGVGLARIGSAFVAARRLFALDSLWDAIGATRVAEDVRLALYAEFADAARGLVADLAVRTGAERPSGLVARLEPPLARLRAKLDRLLRPEPRAQVNAVRARLEALGAPARLVDRLAELHALTGGVGIAALSTDLGVDETRVTCAYTHLGETLGLDWARGAAAGLASQDPWERLLLAGVVRSFETMRLDLMRRILRPGDDPEGGVRRWLQEHATLVEEFRRAVEAARRSTPSLAMLAHLSNTARGVLAAT